MLFSTHSYIETAGINVKMVMQNIEGDPEQNLLGCFDEFKVSSGILQYFKRKNIPPVTHVTWNGPNFFIPSNLHICEML